MSELIDEELDFAVTKALGLNAVKTSMRVLHTNEVKVHVYLKGCPPVKYAPSTNGSQCMDLIEEYRIEICPEKNGEWSADANYWNEKTLGERVFGPTPLIAACRAIVAKEE